MPSSHTARGLHVASDSRAESCGKGDRQPGNSRWLLVPKEMRSQAVPEELRELSCWERDRHAVEFPKAEQELTGVR